MSEAAETPTIEDLEDEVRVDIDDLAETEADLRRCMARMEDLIDEVESLRTHLAEAKHRLWVARRAADCPPDCERDHAPCTRQRWTETP